MNRIVLFSVLAFCTAFVGCESHGDHDHDHDSAEKAITKPAATSKPGAKTEAKSEHDHSSHAHEPTKKGELDVVCNMRIEKASVTAKFEGKTYGFCSANCKSKFDEAPKATLKTSFDKNCNCAKEMENCDCGHCSGKLEACECG